MVKRFYGFFLVLLIVVFFTACQMGKSQDPYFESTGFVMNTVFIQRLYGEENGAVATKVESFLHHLENQLSAYQESSVIGQINEQAGIAEVVIPEDIWSILKEAKEFSLLAPDIFNITAGPLIDLWQIGKEGFVVPTEKEIQKALSLVSIKDLILSEENRTAHLVKQGQSVNLGGLAKGMACEEIKKIYQESGVHHGIVSLGGNLLLLNGKPDGSDFEVGIRNPFGSASQYFATYQGKNVTIATSGSYERYSSQDGKTYSHVLDLRTGYPVDNDLSGVTVICEDGALGDYLSTAIYIQGLEKAKTLLNDTQFGLILVDKQKQVFVSPHIQEKVKITDKEFILQSTFSNKDTKK